MHELGYTQDVIETVCEAAANANANEVRAVYLKIGEVRDIVDDLFKGCFAHFAKGTLAEKAEVNIDRIPFTVRCEHCGFIHPANMYDELTFYCPRCGCKDYRLKTGMEFYIDHLEVA